MVYSCAAREVNSREVIVFPGGKFIEILRISNATGGPATPSAQSMAFKNKVNPSEVQLISGPLFG
jgi:hypothetical protein